MGLYRRLKRAVFPRAARPSDRAYQNGFTRGRAYEAAKTTRVNEKHWASADLLDADAALAPVLATLRNRSHYEVRNGGYAAGIIGTYVADCIGQEGPRLQVSSPEGGAGFADSLEAAWGDFCEGCDKSGRQQLVDLLGTRIYDLWQNGEFFVQMLNDAEVPGPVKLRLLGIDPARIDTPPGLAGDDKVRSGIRVDDDGRPVEYYVLDRHPGANTWAPTDSYETVPARDMIHGYIIKEAGQTRGEPWLAPVLENFAQYRDFRKDTMLAARMAALFAVLLYTDHPDAEFDDCDGTLDVVDLEPGTASMMPSGWRPAQIKPEHPATTFTDFNRAELSEIGRPAGMPYLRVAFDASGHNFSSARLDLGGYWRGIELIQGLISRVLLSRCLRRVVRELQLGGRLPVAGYRAQWGWPAVPQIDPVKEATAQRIRLEAGLSTLAIECKALGHNWEEVLEQRAREAAKVAELNEKHGVELVLPFAPTMFGTPAAPAKDDDDEPAAKPKAPPAKKNKEEADAA